MPSVDSRRLSLLDSHDFRTLFVEELGWNRPDQKPMLVTVDEATFTMNNVATYKVFVSTHAIPCPVVESSGCSTPKSESSPPSVCSCSPMTESKSGAGRSPPTLPVAGTFDW